MRSSCIKRGKVQSQNVNNSNHSCMAVESFLSRWPRPLTHWPLASWRIGRAVWPLFRLQMLGECTTMHQRPWSSRLQCLWRFWCPQQGYSYNGSETPLRRFNCAAGGRGWVMVGCYRVKPWKRRPGAEMVTIVIGLVTVGMKCTSAVMWSAKWVGSNKACSVSGYSMLSLDSHYVHRTYR